MRADRHGLTVDVIAARITEIVADLADVEPAAVAKDVPLFDADMDANALALDSLDSLKLAVALANEWDLKRAVQIDYARATTVREIAQYVYDLMSTGGKS